MDSFVKFSTKILMEKIKIKFSEYDFGIDSKFLTIASDKSKNLIKEIEEFILSMN